MLIAKTIIKRMHDVKKGLQKGYLNGLTEILITLQAQAKVNAPVDTGQLRSSIRRKIKGSEGEVYTNVSYAIYQEEGDKAANGGRGFLKPAVDFIRPRVATIMAKYIRSDIRSN